MDIETYTAKYKQKNHRQYDTDPETYFLPEFQNQKMDKEDQYQKTEKNDPDADETFLMTMHQGRL